MSSQPTGPEHEHEHEHEGIFGHGDGHHHGFEDDDEAEQDYYARRARAIEALLVEKGICASEEIQSMMDAIEARSPADGARVVARAWVDPEYRARLLADPKPALEELGYTLAENAPDLAVVENTDKVHHLVVCTLCSCYPRALLGRPPAWYKDFSYRSRAVTDPRGVMKEFGLELDETVEVRVMDASADFRYLVLPKRPEGTEQLSEEELAKLVTGDSMIGVSEPLTPEPARSG